MKQTIALRPRCAGFAEHGYWSTPLPSGRLHRSTDGMYRGTGGDIRNPFGGKKTVFGITHRMRPEHVQLGKHLIDGAVSRGARRLGLEADPIVLASPGYFSEMHRYAVSRGMTVHLLADFGDSLRRMRSIAALFSRADGRNLVHIDDIIRTLSDLGVKEAATLVQRIQQGEVNTVDTQFPMKVTGPNLGDGQALIQDFAMLSDMCVTGMEWSKVVDQLALRLDDTDRHMAQRMREYDVDIALVGVKHMTSLALYTGYAARNMNWYEIDSTTGELRLRLPFWPNPQTPRVTAALRDLTSMATPAFTRELIAGLAQEFSFASPHCFHFMRALESALRVHPLFLDCYQLQIKAGASPMGVVTRDAGISALQYVELSHLSLPERNRIVIEGLRAMFRCAHLQTYLAHIMGEKPFAAETQFVQQVALQMPR